MGLMARPGRASEWLGFTLQAHCPACTQSMVAMILMMVIMMMLR